MPNKKTPLLPKKLAKFLSDQKVKYKLHAHRTVFTAYDTAQTLKVDLKSVAKSLIVQADREIILVVIPGNKNLDFNALKKVVNIERKKREEKAVKKIKLASEKLIAKNITKKPGAVPPIGTLYKIATYVDRGLIRQNKLIINAGLFELSLELSTSAYKKLAQPVLGSFSKKR